MFTADEPLEQIRTAGRTAASIRVNVELLASASVAVISANAGQVSYEPPSSPIQSNSIGGNRQSSGPFVSHARSRSKKNCALKVSGEN